MGSGLQEGLNSLRNKVIRLYNHLARHKGLYVEAYFEMVLDIPNEELKLTEAGLVHTIDSSKGGVVDYLQVNDLKHLVNGLPVYYWAYDEAQKAGWNHYSDTLDDGEIIHEEWFTEDDYNSDRYTIKLDIPDKDKYLKMLSNAHLDREVYFSVAINKNGIVVNLDETVNNSNLEYLKVKDIVVLAREVLGWDTTDKDKTKGIVLTPEAGAVNVEELLTEFKNNIVMLTTHQIFNNLQREYTLTELDESYLYINTVEKKATLHRHVKGLHFNANTVNNIPFTLTTQYELEDLSVTVSPANKYWDSDSLNGRYVRYLYEDEDYHKFTSLIRHFFPSLEGKKGDLKHLEMDIRLGDVLPEQTHTTPEKSYLTVFGHDTTGNNKPLTQIQFSYGYNEKMTDNDVEQFLEEYKNFVDYFN